MRVLIMDALKCSAENRLVVVHRYEPVNTFWFFTCHLMADFVNAA